jgi:hypothetical protein
VQNTLAAYNIAARKNWHKIKTCTNKELAPEESKARQELRQGKEAKSDTK